MDRVLGFFNVSAIVIVPPRVTDIIVASSSWTPAMIDAVDGLGRGAGNRLGLSLVGSQQLANLPWNTINRIYVKFDKNVSASFIASNMTLRGTNVANYMTTATLAYGVAGTDIGTISLGSPLRNDSLLLTLRTTIVDAGGVALDGEWIDSVSLQSGNGTAGGDFNFRIDSLPGDVNNNGSVNTMDIQLVVQNQQRGVIPRNLATARLDIDGSGTINTIDMNATSRVRGTVLPAPPLALGLALSPALAPVVTPSGLAGLLMTPFVATAEETKRATVVQSPVTSQPEQQLDQQSRQTIVQAIRLLPELVPALAQSSIVALFMTPLINTAEQTRRAGVVQGPLTPQSTILVRNPFAVTVSPLQSRLTD